MTDPKIPTWQRARMGNDFVAKDKGDIGRAHSKVAPEPKHSLQLIPSAGDPPLDAQRIDLGSVKAEISPLSDNSHEVYEKFRKASLENDLYDRWLKRINWGMYFQRRQLDKEAADRAYLYSQEMRELLFKQMMEWKDQRARLALLAKEDFLTEMKNQALLRYEQRDLQARQQIGQRISDIQEQKELAQTNAELRKKMVSEWREANRDVKKAFYENAHWVRGLTAEQIKEQVKRLMDRNVEVNQEAKEFIKSLLLLGREELAILAAALKTNKALRDKVFADFKNLNRDVKAQYLEKGAEEQARIQDLHGEMASRQKLRVVEEIQSVDARLERIAKIRSQGVKDVIALRVQGREAVAEQISVLKENGKLGSEMHADWVRSNGELKRQAYFDEKQLHGLSHKILDQNSLKTALRIAEAIQAAASFVQTSDELRAEHRKETNFHLKEKAEFRKEALSKDKDKGRDVTKEFFSDHAWESNLKRKLMANLDLQATMRNADAAQLAASLLNAGQVNPRATAIAQPGSGEQVSPSIKVGLNKAK